MWKTVTTEYFDTRFGRIDANIKDRGCRNIIKRINKELRIKPLVIINRLYWENEPITEAVANPLIWPDPIAYYATTGSTEIVINMPSPFRHDLFKFLYAHEAKHCWQHGYDGLSAIFQLELDELNKEWNQNEKNANLFAFEKTGMRLEKFLKEFYKTYLRPKIGKINNDYHR